MFKNYFNFVDKSFQSYNKTKNIKNLYCLTEYNNTILNHLFINSLYSCTKQHGGDKTLDILKVEIDRFIERIKESNNNQNEVLKRTLTSFDILFKKIDEIYAKTQDVKIDEIKSQLQELQHFLQKFNTTYSGL